MADTTKLKERDVVLVGKDADNNTTIDYPLTRAEMVEGLDAGFGIVPVGAIIALSCATIPDGYLLCDGSAISRTTYAKLFAQISTAYGAGDGISTFNIPNLQGRVLQGMDANNYAGKYVDAGLPNITGESCIPTLISPDNVQDFGEQINALKSVLTYRDARVTYSNTSFSGTSYGNGKDSGLRLTFNASKSNHIYGNSSTVQPAALITKYIIKY